MTNYIDLVLCKFENCDKNYLFRAPAWSYLKPGDTVVVNNKKGIKQTATVVASLTDSNDAEDETVAFILATANATWPLAKILGKVKTYDLTWDEEEPENSETEEEVKN